MIPFQDGIFAFSRQPVDASASTVTVGTMALLMNALKDYDEANEEAEEPAAAGV
jgi:hypothetical protein